MADKMIFQKDWYESMVNNQYVKTTEQEVSYMLYAAMRYCFYDEVVDLGAVFGPEFAGLNRDMSQIYPQIDKIKNWGDNMGAKNQKYDNPRIKELAAKGLTQKQICAELGYDTEKSKSLSSSTLYKEGRAIYLNSKKTENDSSVKNCQLQSQSVSSFDF